MAVLGATSPMLAEQLDADLLVIATDVDGST